MARTLDEDYKSAYNEGMLQIQRMHYLWMEANNKSRNGQLDSWRWTLDTIWRELSRDAFKKQKGSLQEFEEEFEKGMFKKRADIDEEITSAKKRGDLRAQYDALFKMDMFLRIIQDSVGKGTKYKEDSMDEFD